MNPLKKACVGSVVVMIALMVLGNIAGCSKKDGGGGGIFGSPYSVDYKVILLDNSNVGIEATVKGPVAKLEVVLTGPEGVSDTQTIEQSDMVSKSQIIKMTMRNPQPGKWVLALKTLNPEKVVWQKDISFSLGQLAVENVSFDLVPNNGQIEGYYVEGIKVSLKKDGNLPVEFTEVSAAIGGKECNSRCISLGEAMVDQQHTVKIAVSCSPTPEMIDRDTRNGGLPYTAALFRPGERYSVTGKLFFGKNRSSLDFETEFVVPQKGAQTNSVRGVSPKYKVADSGKQASNDAQGINPGRSNGIWGPNGSGDIIAPRPIIVPDRVEQKKGHGTAVAPMPIIVPDSTEVKPPAGEEEVF
jgi:hypothetical protein